MRCMYVICRKRRNECDALNISSKAQWALNSDYNGFMSDFSHLCHLVPTLKSKLITRISLWLSISRTRLIPDDMQLKCITVWLYNYLKRSIPRLSLHTKCLNLLYPIIIKTLLWKKNRKRFRQLKWKEAHTQKKLQHFN